MRNEVLTEYNNETWSLKLATLESRFHEFSKTIFTPKQVERLHNLKVAYTEIVMYDPIQHEGNDHSFDIERTLMERQFLMNYKIISWWLTTRSFIKVYESDLIKNKEQNNSQAKKHIDADYLSDLDTNYHNESIHNDNNFNGPNSYDLNNNLNSENDSKEINNEESKEPSLTPYIPNAIANFDMFCKERLSCWRDLSLSYYKKYHDRAKAICSLTTVEDCSIYTNYIKAWEDFVREVLENDYDYARYRAELYAYYLIYNQLNELPISYINVDEFGGRYHYF